jgi:RNA polymerase sigma factor (sigma-70 family)
VKDSISVIPLDSARLCARILERESAAEAELIDRFLPRVRTLVAIRTRDRDAVDDLGQEIMLEALCALRREMPRDPERLAAFVFGIARNRVNDHFRRESKLQTDDLSAAAAITDGILTREREMLDDARRGIEALDERDREVLDLSFSEGMEPSEIAHQLSIPAATVRQRKARAIKRLSERLSRRGDGGRLLR